MFTPGKRNTYHIRVENGDIYIFKPYRPEDEEDDRLEYIPEDELEVYNYPPLQGTYCWGIADQRLTRSSPENETSKFLKTLG